MNGDVARKKEGEAIEVSFLLLEGREIKAAATGSSQATKEEV